MQEFGLGYPLEGIDLIIDCTDNFKAKFMCHDLSYQQKIPLIQASIHKFEGQINVFKFNENNDNAPCMRCLWPQTPERTCVQTCSEAGVLGVVPGVVGTLQANEAIKLLIGLPTLHQGATLFIDLLNFSSMNIAWQKNKECPLCNNYQVALETFDYEPSSFELNWQQVRGGDYMLINVSNTEKSAIEPCLMSSLDGIVNDTQHLDKECKIVLFCNRGITSLKAAKLMRSAGYNQCFSLKEGSQGCKK